MRAAVAAWVAALVTLSACSGATATEPPAPGPTASAPSPSPSALASPSPRPTPPTTTAAASTDGALLAVPSSPVTHRRSDACDLDGAPATYVRCEGITAGGGTLLVHAAGGDDGTWVARVLVQADRDADTWREVLVSPPLDAVTYIGVGVEAVTLGPDALAIVGYYHYGSGGVTDVDVVAWPRGADAPLVVAHLPGRGKDDQAVEGAALVLRNANLSDGSPNCCPTLFDRRVLRRDADGAWVVDTTEGLLIDPERGMD